MAKPIQYFAPWQSSLAEHAAGIILAGRAAKPFFDLRGVTIIVPSRFAARLLEEKLAMVAPAGVLGADIVTPEQFLNWGESTAQVSTQESATLAWVETLQSIDRQNYAGFFTGNQSGPVPSFDEARALAEDFIKLQQQLGQTAGGMSFAELAEVELSDSKSVDDRETSRWEALAELEKIYVKKLADAGLVDHNRRRCQLAISDPLPAHIRSIWLVGVSDPQPLLITALKRFMDCKSFTDGLHVIIKGDKQEADLFDDFGQPITAKWIDRRMDWPTFQEQVHVVRKPQDGFTKIKELLTQYHAAGNGSKQCAPYGRVSIVACDRKTHTSQIVRLLHELPGDEDGKGIHSADPQGSPHGTHPIHVSMSLLLDLIETPTFANIRRVLLNPTLFRSLTPPGTSFEKLNECFDVLDHIVPPQHLPDLLNLAKAYKLRLEDKTQTELMDRREKFEVGSIASTHETLSKFSEVVRGQLDECQSASAACEALLKLTGGAKPADEFGEDVVQAIRRAIQAIEKRAKALGMSPFESLRIACESTKEESYRGDVQVDAVNLPGWMEIAWEPTPHMVIYGMTDDVVPGGTHAHNYLPASLRKKLGLSDPEKQFAIAAYTFEQAMRFRQKAGHRLDVIVPTANESGDGIRPSRILYMGETLIGAQGRLEVLLSGPQASNPDPAWNVPDRHKLDPALVIENDDIQKRLETIKSSISATTFTSFLEDPAEFWLKQVLGMNTQDHDEIELGSAGFGTLTHDALKRYGEDTDMRNLGDETKIFGALSACLDEQIKETYGARPPASIRFQAEMARTRLLNMAPHQAKLIAEGWRIHSAERKFRHKGDLGLSITVKYDRLDRNDRDGVWRVFDYKTFAEAEDPKTKHLTTGKGKADPSEFFDYTNEEGETKSYRWTNLQLPCYHYVISKEVKEIGKEENLIPAYFCLPAAQTSDPVKAWDDFHMRIGEQKNFREQAVIALQRCAQAISQLDVKDFKPAPKRSKYSVLKAFGKRDIDSYMLTQNIGVIRSRNAR